MQEKIDRALKILGIQNFLFGIHDPAFPSLPEEDLGCGSPYSEGAAGLLKFVRSLGFNGIQLGPQGITTSANASPYEGSFFSRNPLSLAPLPSDQGLIAGCSTPEKLVKLTARCSCRSHTCEQTICRNGHRRYHSRNMCPVSTEYQGKENLLPAQLCANLSIYFADRMRLGWKEMLSSRF